MSLRAAYWVWRRELHVMLTAPIVYVVGGVFLVVQGMAFAGQVGALSDPRKPSPLGALLEAQLAGTLLTWVLSLVVLTLLGMRAIADDKKTGAWELLLTAQVGEGAAVLGKWAAAATIYALLWVPTLAYLALVAMFRADGGGWDPMTIATGYAGAIAIGAALLAWAVAASAAMGSTLGAGALGFALLVGLFLGGEVQTLWPDLALDHPHLAAGMAAVSVRGCVGAFARGEVGVAQLALGGGICVTGLALAVTLACMGRRRRAEVRARAVGTFLIAAISSLVLALAVRHPVRWDASAAQRNSLDEETRDVLATIDTATLTIVRPTVGALDPIYDEVARVLARMKEVAPGLTVRTVDPASAPGGLAEVARAAGVQQGDLATGGAVIVDAHERRRVIDLFSFAKIDLGAGGAAGTVEQLAIEQAITGALAALTRVQPLTVCVTSGHGELPLAATAGMADWKLVADRLRGDGMTVTEVNPLGIDQRCNVLVVAGPATPLSPTEALSVQTYLAHGGALVVAAPSRSLATGELATTGLEGVLATVGLGLPPAIVVDPSLAIRELPGALLVVDGYTSHAINRGYAGTRATLWFQPRAVIAGQGATPLVTASKASWGEMDLVTAPPARDLTDLGGPVALAAIGVGERVIAIGSAESLSTAVLIGGASAADRWLAGAIRYLAHASEPVASGAARRPDQIRLVMTTAQRRIVTGLSVAGIPLAWIILGGAVVLVRRRKGMR